MPQIVADVKKSIASLDGLISSGPLPGEWYRGQANMQLDPLPAMLRAPVQKVLKPHDGGLYPTSAETKLFDDFMRRAGYLLPSGSTTTDAYFTLQHHGLPTRLLDWTTSILAALYFAVRELDPSEGGLFVLSPKYKFAGGTGTSASDPPPVFGPAREDHPAVQRVVAQATGTVREPLSLSFHAAIPVLPRLRAGRMNQQGSCFTLHPDRMLRSATYADFPVGQLRVHPIPATAKRRIYEQLRHFGITEFSLFPDIDHAVTDTKRAFGLS